MAGEWLKFDSSLPEKPETLAITAAMGWDDPDLTVGKLMRVFRWFDQHTIDGNAPRVTEALLDRMIGATGFSKAMAEQRWLSINESGLALQNFDRHNGATAKGRALTAKRVASHRASAPSNAACNAQVVTPALAREEKRREEKKEKEIAPTELADSPKTGEPPPPPPFDGKNSQILNGKAVVALAQQWELPESWGVDAEALGWEPREVLFEAEKFRQYWTAGKGTGSRRAVKGWRQTWSNWLGKAAERKTR